jgi:putative SOS response-associated peptidase YedK
MCGRVPVKDSPEKLIEIFGKLRDMDLLDELDLPQFNIAPSQYLPSIRVGDDGIDEWALLKWGLTPSWSKDAGNPYKTFNARAETVEQLASFKGPFRSKRCLIAASGFYEWKKLDAKQKQPYFIGMADGNPLSFAGLWDRWVSKQSGEVLESCTIVTTSPNRLMAELHDRMPVIVSPEERSVWLHGSPDEARHVLRPYDPDEMTAYKVSSYVGNTRNQGPECMAPLWE